MAKNVLGGQESIQTKLRDKVRDYHLQPKHQKPKVEKHLTNCRLVNFKSLLCSTSTQKYKSNFPENLKAKLK